MKLFKQAEKAVINVDDKGMAQEIIDTFDGSFVTYSVTEMADFKATDINFSDKGTSFTLNALEGMYKIEAPIYGKYNVSNLLAAIASCHQLGFSLNDILSVIPKVKSPEGRFQIVDNHDASYQIVLDYAHTPDALSHVLRAVKEIPYKKLIVMITGVGLRDPRKRPLMAEEVEGLADEIIVSVDQPGFADREEVVNDVLEGFTDPYTNHIHSRLYREQAIHHAFDLAEPDDLVLLTGIGFGGYQIIGDEKVPYSELEVIDQYFLTNKSTLKETV